MLNSTQSYGNSVIALNANNKTLTNKTNTSVPFSVLTPNVKLKGEVYSRRKRHNKKPSKETIQKIIHSQHSFSELFEIIEKANAILEECNKINVKAGEKAIIDNKNIVHGVYDNSVNLTNCAPEGVHKYRTEDGFFSSCNWFKRWWNKEGCKDKNQEKNANFCSLAAFTIGHNKEIKKLSDLFCSPEIGQNYKYKKDECKAISYSEIECKNGGKIKRIDIEK